MPVPSAQPPARVQLFVTCIIDSLFPHVGEAVVTVLERLGVEVHFLEDQTCCGQPAYNGGFRAESKQVALKFLDLFEPTAPDPIVVPSGSCAAMVTHSYADLFRDDPVNLARAQAVAARTYELAQFLVDVLGVTELGARYPGRLTYHASCHLLRYQHVKDQPRALLAQVAEAEIVPLTGAEECCGFGGLFAVKHGDLSGAILDKKIENLTATGAATLVGCDMSCLLHIQGGLHRDGRPVQCRHLAEILAAR
ncbi:MAG: (Fe-S)-binding protein [Anaerolineales bacterium]|nr:(Fe-S)-binding protein [Anaerolineales bacterium]